MSYFTKSDLKRTLMLSPITISIYLGIIHPILNRSYEEPIPYKEPATEVMPAKEVELSPLEKKILQKMIKKSKPNPHPYKIHGHPDGITGGMIRT